jgi:periplasmic copper chaperone A
MPIPRFPLAVARSLVAVATLVLAPLAAAQVTVSDAWTRAVAPGQMATGAFMRLTAATDLTLVGAASPAAKIVEVHEMKMEGGVMKMSAVDRLPLPAGKPVDLKPGGYHVMLMALREPLKEGDTVPITLTVVDKAGKTQKVEVRAAVRAMTAMPTGMPAH